MFNEKGQSLLELVVSIAIAILVLGALTFAIITSLRNASFASNQAQATKLAQEGLENVRSTRDRGGALNIGINTIPVPSPFTGKIQIEDSGSGSKKITATITWNDASGAHESKLTTILRDTL